jgi:hypothetical protein
MNRVYERGKWMREEESNVRICTIIVCCVLFIYFYNILRFLGVISEGTLPQIGRIVTVANGIEKG